MAVGAEEDEGGRRRGCVGGVVDGDAATSLDSNTGVAVVAKDCIANWTAGGCCCNCCCEFEKVGGC